MKNKIYYYIGGIAVIFIISAILISSKNTALGSQFARHSNCQTSSATSTLSVIASTTYPAVPVSIICDAYNTDTYVYDITPIDSAVLALQYTAASTTASNLVVTITYSNDGIDWYTPVFDPDVTATTSIALTNTVTTVVNRLFDVVTPSRYIKATFTTTYVGGVATSSIWAEIVPKKATK